MKIGFWYALPRNPKTARDLGTPCASRVYLRSISWLLYSPKWHSVQFLPDMKGMPFVSTFLESATAMRASKGMRVREFMSSWLGCLAEIFTGPSFLGLVAALYCAVTWDASTFGWAELARWWDLSGPAPEAWELLLVETAEMPKEKAARKLSPGEGIGPWGIKEACLVFKTSLEIWCHDDALSSTLSAHQMGGKVNCQPDRHREGGGDRD